MSLFDLILPTPAKQQEQLTTLIAKTVTDVMSSSKFSAASAVTQNVSLTAVGAGSNISNINTSQIASINTSAFLVDNTALELKSDLKDKVASAIKNTSSNMPFSREPNINTKIDNIVDKSIETNFSRSSLMELNNSVNQSLSLTAISGANITDINNAQKANVITTFTNKVGTDIASQLLGGTDVSNKSDSTTTNWLSETIGSIGSAIGSLFSGIFTGVFAGPAMLFIIFICVIIVAKSIIGGSHSAPKQILVAAPNPAAPVGGVLDSLGIGSIPPVGGY